MKRTFSSNDNDFGKPFRKRSYIEPTAKELRSGNMYFTKIDGLPEPSNQYAFSLNELLELIRPINSLHFNFMIEVDWLKSQYPMPCRDTPIMLVVGEKMGTDAPSIQKDLKNNPNFSVHAAKLPIPFGTHHTKLSIFECDSKLHVVVSTANLIERDWDLKTQCFYYACGLISNDTVPRSTFTEELTNYLKIYNLPSLDYWIERLQQADFSEISDHIIFSSPGYHKGDVKNNVGLLSLRRRLAPIREESKKRKGSRLFLAQCSSIGSIGSSFETWLKPQLLKTLKGGHETENGESDRFFLIYPCVQDVMNSAEGYSSGASLPYQKQTSDRQPWLKNLFCKWRSETNSRSRAMPHCKTYCELVDGVPQWLLVTSANLSKAAWGEIQKGGSQMQIRSYEMGVLITDKERIRLPYDYPIAKYSKTDEPWICNINYTEVDSCGETWIVS